MASNAIIENTGYQIDIKKNHNASNIIPGFGYTVLDFFENQYVDMESISKQKMVIEESKKPFKSPSKSRAKQSFMYDQSSLREASPNVRETNRSKERKAQQEESKIREQNPPKQYSLLQIKTAVTRYPTINYVSPFTNEEIMEGKRCLLNHYKCTPESEAAIKRLQINASSPSKRRKGKQVDAQKEEEQALTLRNQLLEVDAELAQRTENELKPRQRVMGGVWLNTSDFPHSFQHVIVYHNLKSF